MIMNPYIQLVRPSVILLGAFGALVGAIISGFTDPLLIIIAMLVASFIAAAGNVINDYFDYEIDKINKPDRPIASGKVSQKTALIYSTVLYTIGIVLALYLNIYCLGLAVFNAVLTVAYSWKLKKELVIGNVIPSWLAASSFLFGGLLVGGLSLVVIILSTMAFLANIGREVVKDIEDVIGDSKSGSKTFAIVFGNRIAKRIAAAFVFLAIAFTPIPYELGILNGYYVYIIIISVMVFLHSLYILKRNSPGSQKLMKIAMFLAIVAFLLGTI